MTRVRYTPEEKESALRLCDEIGVLKASEQTGISTNSLYKWRSGAEEELPATSVEGDAVPVEEVIAEEKDAGPIQENITPRKRYTAEQKERALRLCDEIGITKASKETGITVTSLRKWRTDAQNETVTAPPTVDALAQKAAPEQNDSQTDVGRESTAIIARLAKTPIEEKVLEKKEPHLIHEGIGMYTADTGAGVPIEKLGQEQNASLSNHIDISLDERMSEELIRLRIENSTLKAQILALKSALRVFTE